jgi:hypothetical protein
MILQEQVFRSCPSKLLCDGKSLREIETIIKGLDEGGIEV